MAGPLFYDRTQENSTTTGTGTYTLAGATTGYQAWSVVGNANTAYYMATDGTGWEVGLGTYASSGTTLARTTILASSNANAAVSWSAGTRTISLVGPALAFALLGSGNTSGYALIGNGTSAPSYQGFLQSGTGATTRTWNAKAADIVSVKDFGALGTGTVITGNTSITSGAAALTVVGAAFTSADVGKLIFVPGAGAAGATLSTTISAFTDATHVTLSANASTTLSAVSKQVTYGVDDAAAVQAAITSLTAGGICWFPRGIYLIGTELDIAVAGVSLRGEGRGATTLMSYASGHTIQFATGLYYSEVRDMSVNRASYPAVSGQDGIHFTNLAERVFIDNVEIQRHWVGLRCGITGFSKANNVLVNNCYSDGVLVTNADGAGGLQWTFTNILSQQCNGWGLHYVPSSGTASVGEIINFSTYANKLGGMGFIGTDSSHALNAIRIHGGFVGQDGNDEIKLDTYGSSTHLVEGVFIELAGTSACGVDLSTAITNVGNGINATANNTMVIANDNSIIGCSYCGIASNCPTIQITGNNLRINGAANVAGNKSGIQINAGVAQITGNTSQGHPAFGIFITPDGQAITGNNVTSNTTGAFAAAGTITACAISGNIPISINTT